MAVAAATKPSEDRTTSTPEGHADGVGHHGADHEIKIVLSKVALIRAALIGLALLAALILAMGVWRGVRMRRRGVDITKPRKGYERALSFEDRVENWLSL